MIIESPRNSRERTQNLVSFVRDGYRSARGKQPKYTISTRNGKVREIDFSANTISELEWSLLAEMVGEASKFDGPIVEVGVLAGRTTQRIASVKAAGQKILAVDNFCWNGWGLSPDEQFSLVKLSLAYLADTGHVEICRIDKNEFYESYRGPAPSLVFLDAIHDYEETKKDIIWAKEVGVKIICGHDYCDLFPGVIKVVDEFGGPRLLKESLFVL
jgi:hypothetical protein